MFRSVDSAQNISDSMHYAEVGFLSGVLKRACSGVIQFNTHHNQETANWFEVYSRPRHPSQVYTCMPMKYRVPDTKRNQKVIFVPAIFVSPATVCVYQCSVFLPSCT